MRTDLLQVQKLSKRFGERWALQEAAFCVRQGEVLGLIGPNGAGKTTLFECLSGLMPADQSAVVFRDRSLRPGERKKALFDMPDGIVPWADQAVCWSLNFFEKFYNAEAKVADLMRALELGGLAQARIGSLSKGERKRTLLALALLTPQPLLLLDEPFDGLDLRQTRDVMALLREVAGGGRTLMLSIHQLTDAARVCDRLVLLSAGRVVGEGTIDELQAQAKLTDGGLEEIFLALT